jgi:hypothetical protein
LLDGGKYRFRGMVRTEQVAAQTSDIGAGAGLRISGGKRTNKLEGDAAWTKVEHFFDVPDGGAEVELVCELRATKGKVWFERDSLRLQKL